MAERHQIVSALLIAPPAALAGFYAASFVYRLVVGLLYAVTMFGIIVLNIMGVVSSSTPTAPFAPFIVLEWANSSQIAFQVAGYAGALGAVALVVMLAAKSPGTSAWRPVLTAGAVLVGFAAIAGGADLYYGVTPYVDRLMPHSELTAAEREVTCRLTVIEVAHLPDKLSGCTAEVEGVLVYQERMRRFELHSTNEQDPTIKVYFFRGRRPLLGDSDSTGPPRFYDQVSDFVGRQVRIVGTAVNGQLSADVGHIVLAGAQIQ